MLARAVSCRVDLLLLLTDLCLPFTAVRARGKRAHDVARAAFDSAPLGAVVRCENCSEKFFTASQLAIHAFNRTCDPSLSWKVSLPIDAVSLTSRSFFDTLLICKCPSLLIA